MSLTIAEANAINTLIARLVGRRAWGHAPDDLPDDDRLIAAAELLASKAHRALMAGWSGPRAADAVREMLARGRCRVCGCTDDRSCMPPDAIGPCRWLDAEHTLCSACIDADVAPDGGEDR